MSRNTPLPPDLFDGRTHTIAVTGDMIDTIYTVAHYLDGVALPTTFDGTAGLDTRGTAPFFFGPADAYGSQSFNGELYAIRVWPVALSAAQLIANLTTPPDPAGTIGYWDFVNGTLNDHSPTGNSGSLSDGAVLEPVPPT